MVNLTDLWKSQGAKSRNHPTMWVRNDSTQEFINEIGRVTKCGKSHLLSVTTGRFGGTYAHWQIALACPLRYTLIDCLPMAGKQASAVSDKVAKAILDIESSKV